MLVNFVLTVMLQGHRVTALTRTAGQSTGRRQRGVCAREGRGRVRQGLCGALYTEGNGHVAHGEALTIDRAHTLQEYRVRIFIYALCTRVGVPYWIHCTLAYGHTDGIRGL